MKSTIHLVVLCVGIAHNAFGQNATELWKWTADADIRMQVIVPNGDVLVGSENSVTLLSSATGEVVWQRKDMSHQKWVTSWRGALPFPVIARDDEAEFLSLFDRYVRLESSAPGYRLIRKSGRRGVNAVDERDDARLVLIHLDSGKDAFDTWAVGVKPLLGTSIVNGGAYLVAWGGGDKHPLRAVAFDLLTRIIRQHV